MSTNDNPIIDYLKRYVREYKGLPYWSLAMGIQGVIMGMGWATPEEVKDLKDRLVEITRIANDKEWK